MNWGRSLVLGAALAAIGTIATLAVTHWRPDARSEGREAAALPVAGGVPLVKAEPGPIKVKPADPGGLKIPHKDKSIYERFEGKRKPAPAADPGKGKAATPKPGDKKLAQAIGPYRIQLGSFANAETAQKRWNEIKHRHSDLIGGLTMVVERVELKAKGTMFRLQAGPLKTPGEVQKLCGALAKRKVGCLLVKS